VTIVLAVGAVIALLHTGDAQAVSDNAPLIAAVIALGGVGTAQMVSIALEDQRTREARALEDRRTQEARDLEAQRAREAALQNYFENVGELLIEKPLRRASPGDNLSTVVRAQTLSVLEGLDPDRKRILLLFLYESGLIYERKRVVNLFAAKLNVAVLSEADLRVVDLGEADLRRANLRGAVGLTDEQIAAAEYLDDATMPDGQKYEDWLMSKDRGEDGENTSPS
jgi:Pentapeptide repeats (8 copies)